jgi:hypothetical protein
MQRFVLAVVVFRPSLVQVDSAQSALAPTGCRHGLDDLPACLVQDRVGFFGVKSATTADGLE